MLVKEKLKLEETPYGYYSLKRWDTEEGFYIEYIPLNEFENPKVLCKGITVMECIDNLEKQTELNKKHLFEGMIDHIIEHFKLTDEDKNNLIDFCEWCDF